MGYNLSLLPTFEKLSAEKIILLNQNSFTVKYKKNDTIFRQDMPVSQLIFLNSGLVKTYKESGLDNNLIIEIIRPNSFIDLMSSFSKNQYDYSAAALIDCEVVFIDLFVFKNAIKNDGDFALGLLKNACDIGLVLLEKLINLSHKQVPGRIASILLYFSTEVFCSAEFEFPLSRQELADLIATTKESVSRTLTEFKNDRIIDINEKKITIISFDLIKTLTRIG